MTVILPLLLVLVALHWLSLYKRKGVVPGAVVLVDLGLAVALAAAVRVTAGYLLELRWWQELGHERTFWRLLQIEWLPQAAAGLLAAVVLAGVFRLARRRCETKLADSPAFCAAGTLATALAGFLIGAGSFDAWAAALWWDARATGAYRDPLFGHDLAFYFYHLPFYQMLLVWVATLSVLALLVYALTLLLGASAISFMERPDRPLAMNPPPARVLDLISREARFGGAWLLLLFAVGRYLARYALLYSQHRFLYGADYVDSMLGVPLCWAQLVLALLLALLVLGSQRRRFIVEEGLGVLDAVAGALPGGLWTLAVVGLAAVLTLPGMVEGAVRSLYVRPNELTLERPYIEHHIKATLAAFNLAQDAREEPFAPSQIETLDLSQHPGVAQNLRLWDRKPFQDNATQRQALRPYYDFPNVGTDRYMVNGRMRQVLIAERSLETDLLPDNAQTWVNLKLQYTHGYGAVAALVNSATNEGAPELVLQDAPPRSDVPAFQIKRPEIYFGLATAGSVFVDTDQQEFDYPKGDDNAYTSYHGRAGIDVGSPAMRLVTAVAQEDWNVLLTHYLTKDSRLLLHRQVQQRVQRLAPFLSLDPNAYLVIDDSGRLFWMLDAYTATDRHPYSQPLTLGGEPVNYIRNSVKVTVDAYNGTVHFYVFDEKDPLLAAYRRLFPELFEPRSKMPADLLRHIRYPKLIFDAQAETYRTFHMRDPQVFYNKEDQWDVAKQIATQEEIRYTRPYYAMLPLPGETKAEFALMLPFTSRNRDNLIAWIAARCDPEHYGQIIFYRLPKEQLIYGPLQVQSRVDQDRNISKDLSLWNQQGSRVVRGSTLVFPVAGTFLYVEPIYIQATQAKMPELKKLVLAIGNRLVYADDLEEAIAELAKAPQEEGGQQPGAAQETAMPAGGTLTRSRLRSLRAHLQRYRELTSQGKLSQAGRELEELERELESRR